MSSVYDQGDNAFRSALSDYSSQYGSIAQARLGTDIGLESSKESLYSAGAQIKESAGLQKVSDRIQAEGEKYMNEMGIDMSTSGVLTGSGLLLKGVGNTMQFFSSKSGLGLDNANTSAFAQRFRESNAPGRYKTLQVNREKPFQQKLSERGVDGDGPGSDQAHRISNRRLDREGASKTEQESSDFFGEVEDKGEAFAKASPDDYPGRAPAAAQEDTDANFPAPNRSTGAFDPVDPDMPRPSAGAPKGLDSIDEEPYDDMPDLEDSTSDPQASGAMTQTETDLRGVGDGRALTRRLSDLQQDLLARDEQGQPVSEDPRDLGDQSLSRLKERKVTLAEDDTVKSVRSADGPVDSEGEFDVRVRSSTIGSRSAPPDRMKNMTQGDDELPTEDENISDPGLGDQVTGRGVPDAGRLGRNPDAPPQRPPPSPTVEEGDEGTQQPLVDAESQAPDSFGRGPSVDPTAQARSQQQQVMGDQGADAAGEAGTEATAEVRNVAAQGQAEVSSAEANVSSEISQETSSASRTAENVTEEIAPEIEDATEVAAASGWATAGSLALTAGGGLLKLAGIAALPLAGFGLYESIKGVQDAISDEDVDPYSKIRGQVATANAHLNEMGQTISADQFASTIAGSAPKFGSLAAPTFNTAALAAGGATGHF